MIKCKWKTVQFGRIFGIYPEVCDPSDHFIRISADNCHLPEFDAGRVIGATLTCLNDQIALNPKETTKEKVSWSARASCEIAALYGRDGYKGLDSQGKEIESIILKHAPAESLHTLRDQLKIKDAIIQEKNAVISKLNSCLGQIDGIVKINILL